MKLLVDENISHRILKYIDQYFPGSIHVTNISSNIATDLEIWEYAARHNFTIVTYDQDFYEWQQLKGFPPRIIWLRFGNAPTERIANELIANEDKIKKLFSGKNIGLLEIH